MAEMDKRLLGLKKRLSGLMASADQRLEKGGDKMEMLGPCGFLPFGTECLDFFEDLDEVMRAGMRAMEPPQTMADPEAEDLYDPPPKSGLTLLIKCVDLKGHQGDRVLIEDLPNDDYDELLEAVEALPPGTALIVRDPYHFSRALPELTRYASRVIQG